MIDGSAVGAIHENRYTRQIGRAFKASGRAGGAVSAGFIIIPALPAFVNGNWC
jgi:hypothetical protein